MTTPWTGWEQRAAALDAADPLAPLVAEFHRRPGEVYLDGNSLGPLCRPAEAALLRALGQWRDLGIDGWLRAEPDWLSLADRVAAAVAPWVGAAPEEVAVANSTTVNLHQLLATLFTPGGGRTRIVVDELNFSSDVLAVRSHLALRGLDPGRHLVVVRSRDGRTLAEEDVIAAFGPDVAVAVLPAVLYVSGQLLDVARVSAAARDRGVLTGWDLSHAIGAVPPGLAAWGADFAFWCHYKYLNGGPGAAGGLFLARRHFDRAPGLAGWWGVHKARRFDLRPGFDGAPGAEALHIGTPPILSLAPVLGALELANRAGPAAVRRKSLQLTALLMELVDARFAAHGFTVGTPREEARRGGHVALVHPEAWPLCAALKEARVIPDFRRPDTLRLAPSALCTRFADVVELGRRLEAIVTTGAHRRFPAAPEMVP